MKPSLRLEASKKVTRHVLGKSCPGVVENFRSRLEDVAGNLGRNIEINFSEAFVPSFMETWIFAQILLKS